MECNWNWKEKLKAIKRNKTILTREAKTISFIEISNMNLNICRN